jgi:thioredoxin:protein disulfide reductase
MSTQKIVLVAAAAALGIAFVPAWLPAGPEASLDAAGLLSSGQLALGAGIIFLGGLLTAMTPCVYPLIPITVSVFGASKADSRGKAILLTSAYVVGMGVVFSALGVAAARTGALFGSVLADPRFIVVLAILLLALAASMFGAFELQLPSSLAGRLNRVGGSGVAGALLMGSVSGFIAAPCTGPVLSGLLAFVASTQSSTLGGVLLFIYAMGIGLPFFVIGVFAIRLPKGGEWMEWVKSVLGIALVALAASYLKDAFPTLRGWSVGAAEALGGQGGAAIAAGLVLVGVALGAVHRSFKADGRSFALKAFGVILIAGAVPLRMSALAVHQPGQLWVSMGLAHPSAHVPFRWDLTYLGTDEGESAFDRALARAREEGKPVMVDFFAEWCAACKELDHKTYAAPQVISAAERFVNIKVDGTHEHSSVEKLYQRFGVQGLPTVLFIDPGGEPLRNPRITGFLGPEKFLSEMNKVR